MLKVLPLLLLSKLPQKDHPIHGHTCGKTEKGTEPRIMYYWDENRGLAYPFLYKGCGGNADLRYNSPKDIMRDTDVAYCPGYCHGVGKCSFGGWDTSKNKVNQTEEKPIACRKGSFCKRIGPTDGLCCDNRMTERFEKSRKPYCMKGRTAQKYPNGEIFFGRRCSDNFCEKGAHCIQGEFDAHCCAIQKL